VSDDFVLNVRQIAQYPQKTAAAPTDAVLIQSEGIGGSYNYINAPDLLSTALQLGGSFNLAPGSYIAWNGAGLTWVSGAFWFTEPVNVPGLMINGVPVATQADIDTPQVTSLNGRTGDVVLETDDILRAGAAPVNDAHFSGFITAPTAWDFRANSDQVATTAWVQFVLGQFICSGSVVTSFNGRAGNITLTVEDVNAAYAAAVAPDWPTAPNPALGDATNRIATTLFVDDSLQDLQTLLVNYINSGAGVDLSSYAPLASPNFSGTPTAPTAATGVSTGQLATTAFVHAAVVAATTGVASFNTRTGAVTLTLADVTNAGGAPIANPALTGVPTAPNAVLHNSSTQIATTAYVQGELAAMPTAPVTSFNTRTGAIVLTTADVTSAGGAPSASPALTGVPTAPTAAAADSSTTLATTAFVHAAISALGTTVQSFNGRTGAITLLGNDISAAGGALLAGPAFTGAPTTPTATQGTATTQIASTAFVQAAIAAISAGVSSFNTRTGAITLTLADVTGAGGAPLAAPHFTGVPTAPTPAQTSNDTTLATTAYVQAAVAAGGVSSFNSRTGAVTLQANDVSAVGGALLAGPAFTGVPTAPTATTGTNTTQLATTAFVMAQLATTGGVTSFNSRAGAVTLSLADIIGAGGSPVLPKQLSGLTLSNDTVTPTVLDIDVGTACSDDNLLMMVQPTTAMRKLLAGPWVVGNGGSGLDAGSVAAASTWYHVFLIMRPDTGLVDVLFSLSATAPTMPANYTKKRRIGSIKTDTSGNIFGFSQLGDQFLWTTQPTGWDYSDLPVLVAPGAAMVVNTPLGVRTIAVISCATVATAFINIVSPEQPHTSAPTNFSGVSGQNTSGNVTVRTDVNSHVWAVCQNAIPNGFYYSTVGWFDNRGK
jgi:hypothetical protein